MLIFLASAVLGTSIWYSIITGDFSWLSRSGSVVTVLGLLLTIKNGIFSETRDIESVVLEKNHYARWAPEDDSNEYREHVKYAKKVIREEYIGFGITVVGTVIWGYGDLIG